ncbi:hypothetical protein LAUMK191_05595 [Mycobacterium attenuatum]|nr:hypothetical protein LAUMK191_05595 [Mycobacterium attenuatum]
MKVPPKYCNRSVRVDHQCYSLIYPYREHHLCSIGQVGNSRSFTERSFRCDIGCLRSLFLIKV